MTEPAAEETRNEEGVADGKLRRLEAVLMLAREPLSSRKLSRFADLADGTEARTLVAHLNQRYDEVGRAFRVEEVAGGFQLLSRPKFAPWLRRLGHVPPETRLSSPAMETLAVVAYRQPVLRADIEAIRGVNCGEILRQLMERDLVRIGGRSEELGRPYLYATTRRFLQLFGLRDVSDLPRAELLRDTLAQATTSAEDQDPQSTKTINDSEPRQIEEESEVKLTTPVAAVLEEEEQRTRRRAGAAPVKAFDDDDDDDYDEDPDDGDDDEDWDDEDEDFDEDEDWEDEEDLEDEDFDEEDIDEEEEYDEDEDLEEDEWEEVDDDEIDEDEEDWDDEEDEEDDWGDDDDDDDDDD